MFAHELAHRLLPAVETIMGLQAQEASASLRWPSLAATAHLLRRPPPTSADALEVRPCPVQAAAANTTLAAAQEAVIGYVDGERAPHTGESCRLLLGRLPCWCCRREARAVAAWLRMRSGSLLAISCCP